MARLKANASWMLVAGLGMATGCISTDPAGPGSSSSSQQDAILKAQQAALQLPGPVAPVAPPTPDSPASECFNQRFTQPEAQISRKVDLLFITDTSGSLDTERQEIANGIDSFVSQLPVGADYQVAVALAHSPKSSYAGKLYKKGSEPAVLRSSQMSMAQISAQLKTKLTKPATDNASDGGEMGMFAALNLLNTTNLNRIRTQDQFFRADAALVLVFVADENDICAVYPAGVTPVYDVDRIEPAAKAKYCSGVTAEAVIQRVQEVQNGMPSMFGAIVYSNVNRYPKSGENEYGYGFMDIVNLSHGISIDIAQSHYAEGLESIGQLTTTKLKIYQDFALSMPDIAQESITCRVDGLIEEFEYDVKTNKVHIAQAGGSLSTVDIHYCLNGAPSLTPSPSPSPSVSANPSPAPSVDPTPGCVFPNCNVLGI